MEKSFSFGEFDIFAYLMVGVAALIVFDFVLKTHFLFRARWKAPTLTAVLILAYLVGHLVSIPSELFLEELLAKNVLGEPISHLVPGGPCMDSSKETFSWIPLHYYFQSVPRPACEKIVSKSYNARGDDLFAQAFAAAKHDENAYERMMIFQRLYILFRNMTMLSIFAFCALVFRAAIGVSNSNNPSTELEAFGVQSWMTIPRNQCLFFGVLSLGLLDRYLYFYYLYSREVITSFAFFSATHS